MAVDSASKRASVLGVGLVFTLLVIPDGAIAQDERQTIAHSYSGILAGAPVIITPDCFVSLVSTIDDGATGLVSTINDSLGLVSTLEDSSIGLTSTIGDSIGLVSTLCD